MFSIYLSKLKMNFLKELISFKARTQELRNRLEDAEMRAQRTSDDLEQMTAQKMALERDVTELQNDIHRLKANEEAMVAEKWELSAANADLQNRMQTMAITYMQVQLKIVQN